MLDRLRKIFADRTERQSFFEVVLRYFPYGCAEYKLIEKAYDTAEKAFEKNYRESGEKYFEHLRCVALILMIHLRIRNANIIAAALLHDIIEDIQGWTQIRIIVEFNQEISEIVTWVTKPPIEKFNGDHEARERAFHQKLAHAPRPARLVKLADRLHNLLTLWHVSEEKQRRKVAETQDFILPIAEEEIVLIHELEAAINEVRILWQ